jgi:hypothetical protein
MTNTITSVRTDNKPTGVLNKISSIINSFVVLWLQQNARTIDKSQD